MSTIQRVFLTEAILNLLPFPLITHTKSTLSQILLHPYHINPTSILFTRLFGEIIIGVLAPVLLLAYPNGPNAVKGRRAPYYAFGLSEVILIPMLAMEAMKGGKADAALSIKACLTGIGFMGRL